MIWFLLPFATIGFGVVAAIVMQFLAEIVRAARQSKRVAAISIRRTTGARKITARQWAYAFRRELFSGYDSLIVGSVEIPHDPSKPIRDRFFG